VSVHISVLCPFIIAGSHHSCDDLCLYPLDGNPVVRVYLYEGSGGKSYRLMGDDAVYKAQEADYILCAS
jgi:hypothetical protein